MNGGLLAETTLPKLLKVMHLKKFTNFSAKALSNPLPLHPPLQELLFSRVSALWQGTESCGSQGRRTSPAFVQVPWMTARAQCTATRLAGMVSTAQYA